jgi:hypothetical protein
LACTFFFLCSLLTSLPPCCHHRRRQKRIKTLCNQNELGLVERKRKARERWLGRAKWRCRWVALFMDPLLHVGRLLCPHPRSSATTTAAVSVLPLHPHHGEQSPCFTVVLTQKNPNRPNPYPWSDPFSSSRRHCLHGSWSTEWSTKEVGDDVPGRRRGRRRSSSTAVLPWWPWRLGWRNGGRMGGEGERGADKDSGGEVSPGI